MSLAEDRRDARLLVSEGAVLTVTSAAEILGFRDADVWLRDQGLVSVVAVAGRRVERVVWRRVLARLEQEEVATEAPPAPPKRYRLADV